MLGGGGRRAQVVNLDPFHVCWSRLPSGKQAKQNSSEDKTKTQDTFERYVVFKNNMNPGPTSFQKQISKNQMLTCTRIHASGKSQVFLQNPKSHCPGQKKYKKNASLLYCD